ncbi:MAG: hypothetical protein Kow0069_06350 [Promethearchaeota archaeon]
MDAWTDLSGNVHVVGNAYNASDDRYRALLQRYSPSGDVLWNRTFGFDYSAMALTGHGDRLYATGYTQKRGGYSEQAWVAAFDANDGSVVWNFTWGGASDDWGSSITYLDGHVYVAGTTYSYGAGATDAFLLKISEGGTLVGQATWGDAARQVCNDVDSNGTSLFVTGHSGDLNWADANVFLLNFDEDLNLTWSRTWDSGIPPAEPWGDPVREWAFGVHVDRTGAYVTGYLERWPYNREEGYVVKFEPNGDVAWQAILTSNGSLPDELVGYSTWSDRLGGLFFAGYSRDRAPHPDVFTAVVVRLDSTTGDATWWTGRGTGGVDVFQAIAGTPEGRLVAAGYSGDDALVVGYHDAGLAQQFAADPDGDGVPTGEELHVYWSDPYDPDTDRDGLPDGVEALQLGTDPASRDTDGDSMPDGWELENGFDPLNASDAWGDAEGDGLLNVYEWGNGTSPHDPDSDGDGLGDRDEMVTWSTSPTSNDTDGDGLGDGEEVNVYGTDPADSDTDDDGYGDGEELHAGTNPRSWISNPRTRWLLGVALLAAAASPAVAWGKRKLGAWLDSRASARLPELAPPAPTEVERPRQKPKERPYLATTSVTSASTSPQLAGSAGVPTRTRSRSAYASLASKSSVTPPPVLQSKNWGLRAYSRSTGAEAYMSAESYARRKRHFLKSLDKAQKPIRKLGVVIVDSREATVALVEGSRVDFASVRTFQSGVPGKHHAGGWSQARFERLHAEGLAKFLKRVANHANREFLERGVDLLLAGGNEYLAAQLLETDALDYRLRGVADRRVVPVQYHGLAGVREMLQRVGDRLVALEYVRLQDLFELFAEGTALQVGLTEYGAAEVERVLLEGRVQVLLLADSVEETDVGNHLKSLAGQYGTRVEIFPTSTEWGAQLDSTYGGVAALLRY